MWGKEVYNWSKWVRITEEDDRRRYSMLESSLRGKRLLDFGAGNCNFLLKAQRVVEQAVGIESEKRIIERFTKESTSRNMEVYRNLSDVPQIKFDAITMFHVIEHLKDPKNILIKLSKRLSEQGQIFIETPNADDALLTMYENKAFAEFTYWGGHLFLYNHETMTELARQSGLRINYIEQVQRYPLSNHLYWLAKGLPGGHKKYNFFDDSSELRVAYEKSLRDLKKCDTLLGSFSKINDIKLDSFARRAE